MNKIDFPAQYSEEIFEERTQVLNKDDDINLDEMDPVLTTSRLLQNQRDYFDDTNSRRYCW